MDASFVAHCATNLLSTTIVPQPLLTPFQLSFSHLSFPTCISPRTCLTSFISHDYQALLSKMGWLEKNSITRIFRRASRVPSAIAAHHGEQGIQPPNHVVDNSHNSRNGAPFAPPVLQTSPRPRASELTQPVPPIALPTHPQSGGLGLHESAKTFEGTSSMDALGCGSPSTFFDVTEVMYEIQVCAFNDGTHDLKLTLSPYSSAVH
ncbi:hypothetical protein DFH11DRAFT_870645 [Phellopilus nigrolimitatus]|nr:hypothetical protein DFH11DRAFT_870645 [Phellopilus nigrolimitatus]